ncbi:tRNA (adenosine(37)-N6)-dimethylallyltransferase MiaA [Pseudoclavibacter sp. RFBJ3]|nr:tRNA (adenosine(37)-N6)-dimethylallyltransferase MiaA [Pseudoclavibacter sp. AY1H1]PPF85309.1 tRNA (adenosine(37)-N6)-dimethylallyltransferase MiaA [Pseudoclavibacter sp. RFBJ5]PPF93296.1 tRNA (adenosine(37)-N6)-dimethylallyltransferase MiaA [Pseudoclavibacter sp. RFBJ3]PPF98942.1 tRNA (adenosine(37)-N6)-dimethylallyltransferase MiaA [Pseudoclavibacter sp. RFBH5]PPG24925.1 tRNA (adenosine(37)-N6)-dimethylallyltransferase MiaA [Pseudoclavibacter sp. RFBI4]
MSVFIAIGGATGTGKSQLSLDIAARLRASGRGAQVINADAMQLYRGMDVGTAKLAPEDREGVPHHLLDVLDVTEDASVAWYQERARGLIEEIEAEGDVPILVGGSGLYIAAVCFDLRFPGTDPAVRAELEAELQLEGPGPLFARLRALDPQAAATIDARNGRRLVRALEVIEVTGEPFSAQLPDQEARWRDVTFAVVEEHREVLTPRLGARVERMWESGLLEETQALAEAGLEQGGTAKRAIGYQQALAELRGEMSRAEAIAEAQLLTRKYARRQVSWFRRYESAVRAQSGEGFAAQRILQAAGL